MLYHPASSNYYIKYICETLKGEGNPYLLNAVDQACEWILYNEVFPPSKSSRRLSDVILSVQLQISRNSIRQALDRLAQQGLILFIPRKGYWTKFITVQDIAEIYDLCETNEMLSLKLAIPYLKEGDLQTHLDTVNSMRKTLPFISSAAYLEFDYRLHNFIINSSGNKRLIAFLLALRSQIALFHIQFMSYPQRIEIYLMNIEQFLIALKEGK